MASEERVSEDVSTYIIDSEQAAELNRLKIQHRTFSQAANDYLYDIPGIEHLHTVLDLACGPGDWAVEIAEKYPHLRVSGVDISNRMIAYAQSRQVSNTHFQVMDILHPLNFPSESFDIVNARLLAAVLPTAGWDTLLRECFRIVRPGGYVQLTEVEYGITNKPAGEQYARMFTHALYKSGHSFSPSGREMGITPMLWSLLENAGFSRIQQRAFFLDGSARSLSHQHEYENAQLAFLLIQSFLIQMGEATEEELSVLYEQVLEEIRSPDFCAINYGLVALGQKVLD